MKMYQLQNSMYMQGIRNCNEAPPTRMYSHNWVCMTNNDVTSTTTHMYRYFTVYLYVNNIENSIDTCGYKAFPLSLDIGNGSCCHCQQSVTCSEDWEKGSEEREKRIPLSLVPRLFLIEERAWQHWGVRAVYFRYVMIHGIYSDHVLFCKLSCDFCDCMYVVFQTVFGWEKQHKALEDTT